jgi:hypothetical protein
MDKRNVRGIIAVVVLLVVVYVVDSLFFRGEFWLRLIANIAIVVVFFVFIYKYVGLEKVRKI